MMTMGFESLNRVLMSLRLTSPAILHRHPLGYSFSRQPCHRRLSLCCSCCPQPFLQRLPLSYSCSLQLGVLRLSLGDSTAFSLSSSALHFASASAFCHSCIRGNNIM